MARHLIFVCIFCCAIFTFTLAQKPSMNASNLTINAANCTDVTLRWTKGNGSHRVVFAALNSPMTNPPYDGARYNPHPVWGFGSPEGMAYCVYNGSGDSVKVLNLRSGYTFYFYVYEYNITGNYQYLSSGQIATDSFTTDRVTAQFTNESIAQCFEGNKFTHTNNSTGPAGETLSYQWDITDYGRRRHVYSDTAKELIYSYKEGGEYRVKLEVRSSNGCIDSMTSTEVVIVPYTADFMLDSTFHNVGDTLFCKEPRPFPTYIRLKNTSTPSQNAVYPSFDRIQYYWSTNLTPHRSQSTHYSVNTQEAGPIRVQLVTSRRVGLLDGCMDTMVKQYKISTPFKSQAIHVDTISDTLTNNTFRFWHDSQNIVSLTWNFGDGTTSTLDTATHSYSKEGWFNGYVIGTDTNGCTDSIPFKITVFGDNRLSVNGIDKSDLVISPNPATHTATILGDEPGTPSYRIYDLNGRAFLVSVLDQTRKISVSTLPKGVYILEIEGYAPVRFIKL